MFSSNQPWAFGFYRNERAVIMGFEHTEKDGLKKIVVALVPGGEIIVADIKDVKIDLKRVIDLTKPPTLPGDEWKHGR